MSGNESYTSTPAVPVRSNACYALASQQEPVYAEVDEIVRLNTNNAYQALQRSLGFQAVQDTGIAATVQT